MRIEKVILKPFGGISKEFELKDVITTVFGPNEAGKSTIFYAIENVLFTPSNVMKSTKEYKELSKWFPVGGGDTISVGLIFNHENKKYSLFRSWGHDKRDSLVLPNGEPITDNIKIKEFLAPMLLATEGTYKSVLLTYQSGLSKTIQELKTNKEPLKSVGNLIRRSFMETDGIQIEKFKASLNDKYENYFKNWDIVDNKPIRKKDLSYYNENYYGELGNTFLDIQNIKKEIKEAEYLEKQLEEKSEDRLKKEEEITKYKEYLGKYENAYQVSKKVEKLNKISGEKQKLQDWKDKSSTNIELNRSIVDIESKKEDKEIELRSVEITKKFQKVKYNKKQMENNKDILEKLKKITKEDIRYLRELEDKLKEIKIKSESEKISARVTAKKQMDIEVKKGIGGQYFTESIQKDHKIDLDAQGKLTLRHSDWTVEVSAGEENIEDLTTEYQIKEKEMREYLTNLGVRTFEEAEICSDKYGQAIVTYGNFKKEYEKELTNLGISNFNQIEEQLKGIENIEINKDIMQIGEDIGVLKTEITTLKEEFRRNKQVIENIEKEYGDRSKIEPRLDELEIEYSQIKQNISESPKMPEEIKNIDSFILQYEENKDNYTHGLKELNDLILEYGKLDSLEVSSDVLEQRLIEKEKIFQDKIKKANALKKVRDLSNKILSETSNPDEILIKKVEEYFSFITGGKYNKIVSNEYLPDKIVLNNCGHINELEQRHLSTGTMDALALALRIAMAEYLLGNDGFLIMDDPLVDMDPDRQNLAAQLLRDSGNKRQVIVFTCHPNHADMIGGRVDL